MNTAVINIKTEAELKAKAQKAAADLGISLTAVINQHLKHFVKTKSVTFDNDSETPSPYLIKTLKKSEEDIKKGRVSPGFSNAKDAIKWLNQK